MVFFFGTFGMTTLGAGGRELVLARLGLIRHRANEVAIGNRLINPRTETVAEKPSFRDTLRKRSRLAPATGLYDWVRPRGSSAGWSIIAATAEQDRGEPRAAPSSTLRKLFSIFF